MIVGLGKAAQLVNNNLKKFTNHMKSVRDYLEDRLMVSKLLYNFKFWDEGDDIFRISNRKNSVLTT